MKNMIPGFRFRPTGVELLKYFLKRKLMGKKFDNNVIAEFDIYKYAPWDLPCKSHLQDGDELRKLGSYVICKVFQKEGPGPRNGAQYGRPFKEEDWSDDDEVVGLPFAESAAQVPSLAVTTNSSVLTGSMLPSPDPANHSYPCKQAVNDDDILSMLDIFNDCDIYPEENIAEGTILGDFFEGLEDLDCSALGSFGQNTEFSTNGIATMGDVGCDNLDFIELTDLDSEVQLARR